MIDGQNIFDKPVVKNGTRTFDNIRYIATDQRDDLANGCSLSYPYFKEI